MESGVWAAATEKTKATEEEMHDLPEEEVAEEGGGVVLLEESKYAHMFRWLYKLHDTSETILEPMRLSLETEDCEPSWTDCTRHVGCPMMQILSLELTSLPSSAGDGPVQLYGFMAVRDPLDPLRNYVFNRSRDDPYTVQDPRSDASVRLSGPKRGVCMQKRVLVEYDVKIKGAEAEHGDLPLVHGVAVFGQPPCSHGHGAVTTTDRIAGRHGAAVDVTRAFFPRAVEATVQVRVAELTTRVGLDLCITASVSRMSGEIKAFRGVIDRPCELHRFVIAVGSASCLFLNFQVPGGSDNYLNLFAFRATAHGFIRDRRKLEFATVDVKVTWASLC